MNVLEVVRLIELFSVACVVIATIYIMQHILSRAHYLLRLGLALVCAGSVMEFYGSLQVNSCDSIVSMTGVVENLGQAAVYVWAATSRRMWRVMNAIAPKHKR